MTRKGGGRESDEVVQGNAPPRQADVGTLSAAANPAARPLLQCPVGLDGAYHSCCQQVRALEAELADVRKWLDATHANQQDLVMERNDAVARAEKAEARVKELEALPPGLHRHPPQTQVCGCDNRTAADLRGEDRG